MRLSDVCNRVFPRVLSAFPQLQDKKILCVVADLDNPGVTTALKTRNGEKVYVVAIDRSFALDAGPEEVETVMYHELNEVRFNKLTPFLSHPLSVISEKRTFAGFSSYVRSSLKEKARKYGWKKMTDRQLTLSILSALRHGI